MTIESTVKIQGQDSFLLSTRDVELAMTRIGGMLAPVTEVHYGEEALLRLNLLSHAAYPSFIEQLEADGVYSVELKSLADDNDALADLVELGLQHEQQHQELLVTDLKHVFSVNPLRPVYRESVRPLSPAEGRGEGHADSLRWIAFEGGEGCGKSTQARLLRQRFN